MAQSMSVGTSHLPPTFDPERLPEKPSQTGYPSFSALIASDPDLQIYRRFNRLSARNLLYLQAELLEAERRLDEFDAVDHTDAAYYGDLDVMLSIRCWEAFSRKAQAGSGREGQRMELIRRVRELLREYRAYSSRPSLHKSIGIGMKIGA